VCVHVCVCVFVLNMYMYIYGLPLVHGALLFLISTPSMFISVCV
jgi:hypothetical protein